MTNHKRQPRIPASEIQITFIRSPGPGGQNVNKLATAVQLRFNITNSTAIDDECKNKLFILAKNYISSKGDLIIKASRFRTQERNRQDAQARLIQLILRASVTPKKRKKTKVSYATKQKRLSEKKQHGQQKSLRSKQSLARE